MNVQVGGRAEVPPRRGERFLFPARKRCMRCRSFFGFLVLAGLWCSYECAGHPVPSSDPADWPREHRLVWRLQRAKRAFDSEDEANGWTVRQGKTAYPCGYCLMWHVGTTRSGDLSRSPRTEERA